MTPDDRSELLNATLQKITEALVTAWDEVWAIPNHEAAFLVDEFLAGRVIFEVDRAGITILRNGETP